MGTVLTIAAGFAVVFLLSEAASAFGFGSDTVEDLGGMVDQSTDSVTIKIAQAIARAEGFYVAGSRPARNHNPGDMTADLIGKSTGKDGMFVVYANDADGWENLYAQVNAWLDGTSRHANIDSTIAEISQFYTTTDQNAWAFTVASALGVDPDTSLGELA